MKKTLAILAIFVGLFAVGLNAQSVVSVTPTDKLALTASAATLDGFQEQGVKLQSTFNHSMSDLKWKFSQAQHSFDTQVETARTHLNLPKEATFDLTTFSFNVPKPAVATPAPTPAATPAPSNYPPPPTNNRPGTSGARPAVTPQTTPKQ